MRFLLFLLLFSTRLIAQDFSSIKEKTHTYSGLLSAEELAKNLQRDFISDKHKVQGLFCWITKNIRYDLDEFYNPNRKTSYSFRYRTEEELKQKIQKLNDTRVTETLKSKKAVCEGYAQTFSKICTLLNIENKIIEGYIRRNPNSIGKPISNPNHAWNAVKLNNKWIYIDATWASGYEINGRWLQKFNPYYYNIAREKLFKTHFPEKSIWRLRIGRMKKEDFYKQPIYKDHFLSSDIKLLSPTTGFLIKKEGKISIQLKNCSPNDQFHIAFAGVRFAKNPDINTQNNITNISIAVPNGVKETFLMINKQVSLTFLIK